jgi:chemotaxis protein MotB
MVTVLESVLFDSGQGQISPDGLAILKRVSEMLKDVKDGQIRIEGHTDNVPVGEGLSGKFPTNWELSAARAASVVRYLIEESGVDRSLLSAAGFADTKPVASNDSEEGRKANRRIEITMQPNLPIKVAGE